MRRLKNFLPSTKPHVGGWRERAARVARRRTNGETVIRSLQGDEILKLQHAAPRAAAERLFLKTKT